MNAADEFLHQVKHAATQQQEAYRPDVYGHVASYDPVGHRVRLVIPSLGDGDGNYVLTGWMPLGTIAAGNGWGVQIAPMGGASVQDPTGGEKCKISIMERNYGVAVCAEMCFDQVYAPPFTTLQPGEIAVKAQSGSYLYFHENGQVELTLPTGDLAVTAVQGNVAVIAEQGDATVVATAGQAMVHGRTARVTADELVAVVAPLISLNNGSGSPLPQPVKLADNSDSTVVLAQ